MNHVALVSNSAPSPHPVDARTIGESTSSNKDHASLDIAIVEREELTPTMDDSTDDPQTNEIDVESVSHDTTADSSEMDSSSNCDRLLLGEIGVSDDIVESEDKTTEERGGRGKGECGREGGGKEQKEKEKKPPPSESKR